MESHEGDEEKIAAFMEIVGKPADKAREFLQATNWHLEEAIQLFYAGGDDLGSTAPTGDATTELPWDATANQSESGLKPTTSSPIEPGEDYVRPPLPVKREALYDDIFEYRAQHLAQSSNQPASIDAFRNFQDEANFRNQASGDDASNIDGSKDSLAALYRPPFTLIYQGSFEQAKVEAAKQGKWLLVNLQSTKEFSSYMLNRDTWAHHTVQYMVQSMFIFWQVYDDTEEGRKVCTYYKLTTMPTIMIVDPLTGQKMRSWEGMVGAERLLELGVLSTWRIAVVYFIMYKICSSLQHLAAYLNFEEIIFSLGGYWSYWIAFIHLDLVLYTDRGPLEHKPANLPPPKRQRESNYPKDTFAGPSNSSEEEELQRALAASLQDTREVPMADKNGITSEYEDVKPDTIKDTPKVDAKLQYPPLPEEPAYTDATVCRIAVRFPDGSRGQRKFLRTDPIQVLWSFCLSKVGEASNGKSFRLTESIPGVVGKVLDFNLQSSIGDAGLANSILVMTWD